MDYLYQYGQRIKFHLSDQFHVEQRLQDNLLIVEHVHSRQDQTSEV